MSATAIRPRFGFAGFPVRSWAFAVRVWIAVTISLLASFWFDLEVPFSAALTVGILAEPTRGQALEKAGYRLLATIIGMAASIAITGVLGQSRDLLLAAFAAWLGLCVFMGGLLDGYRTYAAVLSGFTVALIAVEQIDTPQHIFESGVARAAAVAVGILSITIVNDMLLAPDRYPQLIDQLAAIHRRIRQYAKAVMRGEAADPTTAAALIRDIVALRPEVTSLATESISGAARSAAARGTLVALMAELHAVRALNALPTGSDPAIRQKLTSALDWTTDEPPSTASVGGEAETGVPDGIAAAAAWAVGELLRRDRELRVNLSALESGARPPRAWQAPLYRSRRIAVQGGVRAAACFASASVMLVLGGWSAASSALSWVAIIIGLGTTTPNQRRFTTNAVIAAPIAVILAGLLKFVVLDGVSDFPLLAIGLAPVMIGAALLMMLPNPVLASLGRLNLVFIPTLLMPSNRETYDPQQFLFGSLFLCLGTVLVFAAQRLIPPVSNDDRSRWLLASARRDLDHVLSRRRPQYAPEEATFRDADRVGQIAAAGGTAPQHRASLEEALSYFDQAAAIRFCDHTLTRLADGPFARLAAEARTALASRDVHLIRAVARRLCAKAGVDDCVATATSSALVLAGAVIEGSPLRAPDPRRIGLSQATSMNA